MSGKVFDLRSRVETLKDVDPETDPIRVISIGKFSELEHVSELMNQRVGALSNLASVNGQFTESHPRYIEAKNRVNELENQLRILAADLKESLEADYTAAVTNEIFLTERVATLQSQLTGVKTASSEFRAIQQQVETEWQVHQSLRDRIGQTSLESEKSNNITRLMYDPIVAHKPATPRKSIAALLGLFAGGFCCCGLIGVDLLRGRPFLTRRKVEQRLDIPVVAEIEVPLNGSNDAALLDTMTSILLTPHHRNAGIIHLSSLLENDEGLRVAACLASASAYYTCPTLLVSVAPGGDPRMPVSLVAQPSQTENLHTLRLPSSFLIAPSDAWQLLGPHRQQFSRIIIESTAFSQESQIPGAVAAFSDANLILVKKGYGSRQDIEKSIARLGRGTKGSLAVILHA